MSTNSNERVPKETMLHELKKDDIFEDSDIVDNQAETAKHIREGIIHVRIIGDHVYTLTNQANTIVIASDLGNGVGQVMEIVKYNEEK